jgi:hypothetical protein
MATDYFEVIRKFIAEAITHNNGQVKIHSESIENLCKVLLSNKVLFDRYGRKKVETNEDRDKFCREFNWFYNQLFFISINTINER